MTTMTLSVPNTLKQKMDTFPEMNWSEVARQAFLEKIEDMGFLKKFKERSKLTEAEAMKLGKEVSRAISKRLRKKAK